MMNFRLKSVLSLLAIVSALTLVSVDFADAQRRGGSVGSRGSRTYTAPPATNTAPSTAAPINRSMTQPGQTATAPRPGSPAAGGFFNRPGLMGGLMGGLLGAGLIGLLMGNGLLGGLGGLASIMGLLLQVALIGGIAFLVYRWWQGRQRPATASGPAMRDYPAANSDRTVLQHDVQPASSQKPMGLGGLGGALGGLGAGLGGRPAASSPTQPSDEIGLKPEDFDAFEQLLVDVQTTYSKGDLDALGGHVTPEILSYFAEEITERNQKGLLNEVSDVKLLQGDLAEAWREGDTDYATVAMRFSMLARTTEKSTGRVVDGGGDQPIEITEIWTFRRDRNRSWEVSALQETA